MLRFRMLRKRTKGLLGLSLALVTAAGLTQVAHARLAATPLPKPASLREALPSIGALQLLSLGYDSVAADYYWLRALSEFGDNRKHRQNYPNLIALTERVLALDAYFGAAYHFAGTALTVEGLDPRPSIALLEQGLRRRPNDWKIAFLLGFNSYYFAHDYVRGAEALAIAARIPGAPEHAGPLAARLAAEAGAPEVGLALVDSILPTVKEEKVREEYLERKKLLTLELHLKWLNEAVRVYREQRGTAPSALGDMLQAGILSALPDEPLGGRYFLDADGRVKSTNEERRLRLNPRGMPRTP